MLGTERWASLKGRHSQLQFNVLEKGNWNETKAATRRLCPSSRLGAPQLHPESDAHLDPWSISALTCKLGCRARVNRTRSVKTIDWKAKAATALRAMWDADLQESGYGGASSFRRLPHICLWQTSCISFAVYGKSIDMQSVTLAHTA
jgi:hypothetical protein